MTTRPTALITGASSGIGLELARCAAADQYDVVLLARSSDKLGQLASTLEQSYGIKAHVLVLDLAAPDLVTRLSEAIATLGVQIDVLVNNAGFGERGLFAQLPLERQLAMVQVNIAALTAMTHLLLPGMLERRRGGVLNVASTAAFQGGPAMAVYYASKAFVLHFSEALHDELRGTGVAVSCLCPGPTITGFADAAQMDDALLFKLGSATPQAVARSGWLALQRNRSLVIHGWRNAAMAFSNRLAPRGMTRAVAYQLQKKR